MSGCEQQETITDDLSADFFEERGVIYRVGGFYSEDRAVALELPPQRPAEVYLGIQALGSDVEGVPDMLQLSEFPEDRDS
jgi:hypothetical protein